MLNVNICPGLGLANGSCGTIVDIIPNPEESPPNCPKALIIHFPTYCGRSFDNARPNLVALPPQSVTFDLGSRKVLRKGFAVRGC